MTGLESSLSFKLRFRAYDAAATLYAARETGCWMRCEGDVRGLISRGFLDRVVSLGCTWESNPVASADGSDPRDSSRDSTAKLGDLRRLTRFNDGV